jgi:hypothetical protein
MELSIAGDGCIVLQFKRRVDGVSILQVIYIRDERNANVYVRDDLGSSSTVETFNRLIGRDNSRREKEVALHFRAGRKAGQAWST